jgi:hypothetical protein
MTRMKAKTGRSGGRAGEADAHEICQRTRIRHTLV